MPRATRSRVFYLLLGAVMALVFTAGSFSLGRLTGDSQQAAAPSSIFAHPAFAQAAQVSGRSALSVADVAERSLSSVVNISSSRKVQVRSPYMNDPFFRDFFRHFGPGEPSDRQEASLGSGVIVSAATASC
jgi:S1-C subfamily serine protease